MASWASSLQIHFFKVNNVIRYFMLFFFFFLIDKEKYLLNIKDEDNLHIQYSNQEIQKREIERHSKQPSTQTEHAKKLTLALSCSVLNL